MPRLHRGEHHQHHRQRLQQVLFYGAGKTSKWRDWSLKEDELWAKTTTLPVESLATVEEQQERFMRTISLHSENSAVVCLDVRREMTDATSSDGTGLVIYTGPCTVNGLAIRPACPGLFPADAWPPVTVTVTVPTTTQNWELQSVTYPPAIHNGRKNTLPKGTDSAEEAWGPYDIHARIEEECEKSQSIPTVVTVPIFLCKIGDLLRKGGWANYRRVSPEETVSTAAVSSSVGDSSSTYI